MCFTSLITYLKNKLGLSTKESTDDISLSLRDNLSNSIKEILQNIDYPNNQVVCDGISDIVNMVADYHEEGQPLFPDVLIVKESKYFSTFLCRKVMMYKKELKSRDFSKSIKMCAPLAVDGWSIYIVLHADGKIEYGVITSEIRDLSLPLYDQTVATDTPEQYGLYIRNIGNKNVEICTAKQKLQISLTASKDRSAMNQYITELSESILPKMDKDDLREIRNYLKKVILQALNEGHGNLVAVVDDNRTIVDALLKKFHGGIYLAEAIEMAELAMECKNTQTEEASVKLRSFSSLMKSMLNFDGITLFSNTGKILGYHFIVNNNEVANENIEGGSRTRAYEALCGMNEVLACFMKSQDGNIKFNRK